jgi:glutaconate CoA-transferase, subunit A
VCRITHGVGAQFAPGKAGSRLEFALTDKRRSLREAIAENVHDGNAVALGLALESGIPFAAVHEMIRQQRRDLTLIGPISDMAFDQLIAAGTVAKVIAAWVGNVAGGSGYGFRRAYEQGVPRRIVMEDHTNFTVGLALKAAAMGLPYLPTFTGIGGDIVRGHPRIRPIEDPFNGPRLLAVCALKPDVAIIHVQRADAQGNAHLWGNLGLTIEAAYAARRTIVICEEIVPDDVIRSDPNRTVVPGFLTTAVVEEPGGALPSSVQGYWRRDFEPFLHYHQQSHSLEGFQSWLREWVLDLPDRPAYLRHMGEAALGRLRVRDQRLAAAANFAP